MRKFRVVLPIEVDGRIYEFGAVIELDVETARLYSHALIMLDSQAEEEVNSGGNT
jgi:hypothetical protein